MPSHMGQSRHAPEFSYVWLRGSYSPILPTAYSVDNPIEDRKTTAKKSNTIYKPLASLKTSHEECVAQGVFENAHSHLARAHLSDREECHSIKSCLARSIILKMHGLFWNLTSTKFHTSIDIMATPNQILALRARLVAVSEHDDVAFRRILESAMKVLGLTIRDVSDAFEVSRPTVERWLAGTAVPHPMKIKAVYEAFKEKSRTMAASIKKVAPDANREV